jgi:hypothetical protein
MRPCRAQRPTVLGCRPPKMVAAASQSINASTTGVTELGTVVLPVSCWSNMYTLLEPMATTRNKAFKSPSPRLQSGRPSHFEQKLEPWFVEFARFFKQDATSKSDLRRRNEARRNSKSQSPLRTNSVPAPILPGWPQTLGEMLAAVVKSGDAQVAGTVRAMMQDIPKEALATDLNQVFENATSLLKYQATVSKHSRPP